MEFLFPFLEIGRLRGVIPQSREIKRAVSPGTTIVPFMIQHHLASHL